MKKLIIVLTILAILFVVTPAMASEKVPVGPALSWTVYDFTENSPFHMRHGWGLGTPPIEDSIGLGLFKYELELDGEILKPDFKINYDSETGQLTRLYVFNFPDGMTGVHDFVHHYFGPCYLFQTDCEFPYKSVEAITVYQEITFTP